MLRAYPAHLQGPYRGLDLSHMGPSKQEHAEP